MDINTLRGLSTLLLLVAFVGLVIWVYRGRNKKGFDEASKLPFADEDEMAHRKTLDREARESEEGEKE